MERKNPILQKGKGKSSLAAKGTSRGKSELTGKSTGRGKAAGTTRKKNRAGKGLSPTLKVLIFCVLLVLLSPFYYGYVIKGFSSTWRWITDIGEDPNYRTYSSYNIKNSFDQKIAIYNNICYRLSISDKVYQRSFSAILKSIALNYYFNNILKLAFINKCCIKLRYVFKSPDFYRRNLDK